MKFLQSVGIFKVTCERGITFPQNVDNFKPRCYNPEEYRMYIILCPQTELGEEISRQELANQMDRPKVYLLLFIFSTVTYATHY